MFILRCVAQKRADADLTRRRGDAEPDAEKMRESQNLRTPRQRRRYSNGRGLDWTAGGLQGVTISVRDDTPPVLSDVIRARDRGQPCRCRACMVLSFCRCGVFTT